MHNLAVYREALAFPLTFETAFIFLATYQLCNFVLDILIHRPIERQRQSFPQRGTEFFFLT